MEHQVSSFIKYSDPAGGSTVADATLIKQGERIKYTLQLNSEAAQQDITISDVIPEGLSLIEGTIKYILSDGTVVSVLDAAYDAATNKIVWPTINVQAGITKFEFEVVVDRLDVGNEVYAKLYANKAILEYSDETKEPVETNEVFHKSNAGIVTLDKTAATILVDKNGNEIIDVEGRGEENAPIKIEPGQVIQYKLTVDRTADEENISGDIVVTDAIPMGATFVEGSITGTIITNNPNTQAVIKSMELKNVVDVDGTVKPGIEWVISGLSDGEKVELTFRVTTSTETDDPNTSNYESAKLYTNTASIEDKEIEDKKESETTYHQTQAPVLEALKTSNPQAGTAVKAGDSITYSIQVKNIGEGIANNVIIRDAIPEYTSYIPNTATSNKENTRITSVRINGKETLVWVIEELQPNESVIVSFQVTVNEMKETGIREIKNTAQIKIPAKDENIEEVITEEGYTDTNEVTHTQETPTPATKTPAPSTSSTPKTGDGTNIELLVALLVVSVMLTIYTAKRKKHKKN